MSRFKLLTVGNPKIEKSVKFGWLTAVLHLAPSTLSGYNVCAKATPECIKLCLNIAGRGGIAAGGILSYEVLQAGQRTNAIQLARVRKTKMYYENRNAFMALLVKEIRRFELYAESLGLRPAIRLNGTSDIPWERVATPMGNRNVMCSFPRVQFYDYTKRPNRKDLPRNYHLTFSLADGNDSDAVKALANGMSVAAVFAKVPAYYAFPYSPDYLSLAPFRVIDGDQHDLRFLDAPGSIVGLKAKGAARKATPSTYGFVR